MKITFITSNCVKFAIADSILKHKGISLVRNQMNLEEIQSENVLDIARNSAKIAFSTIKKSVAVTDAGFYITALNGFPGPFVKYANRYFDADKLIQLMSDEPNRELIVREALVVIDDFGAEHCYQTEFYGSVATNVYCSDTASTFEKIFIPKNCDRPIAAFSKDEQFNYWKEGSTWNFVECADYQQKR